MHPPRPHLRLRLRLRPPGAPPRRRALSTAPAPDLDAYMQAARTRMARQPAVLIPDTLSPTPTQLLDLALADHLPPSLLPGAITDDILYFDKNHPNTNPATTTRNGLLPPGHHLVYFPPHLRASALMPDGTDPAHCPGAPFTRRMWAGGSVRFFDAARVQQSEQQQQSEFRADGRRAWCRESVGEPVLRRGRGGGGGDEKVFVEVTREYGLFSSSSTTTITSSSSLPAPVIEEKRMLVFLPERGEMVKGEGVEKEAQRRRRIVKAPAAPDASFALTPDARLLFHFSALTYNAHAIHYDPLYARGPAEGYPALVVHGPLALVLLLTALRSTCADATSPSHLSEEGSKDEDAGWTVSSIDYRNVAPLFADEPMRVCWRLLGRNGDGDGDGDGGKEGRKRWSLWIERPDGGLAVKATAETVRRVIRGHGGRRVNPNAR